MGQRLLEVAVVGADSIAGADLVESLEEAGFPMGELSLFASGEEWEGDLGDDLEIQPLSPGSLAGKDLVFLLPGVTPPAERIEEAIRGGATILDGSGRERQDSIPLIFPWVNEEDLEELEDRYIAVPTPAASQLASILLPLHGKVKMASVHAVAFEAVATKGMEGLNELSMQTVDLLQGKEPERRVFQERIAFNLIPRVGALGAAGETDWEKRVGEEVTELLETAPPISVLSAWAPIFHGSTQIVTVELEGSLKAEEAAALFRGVEGVKLLDDREHGVIPMPMLAVGDEEVLVGRIRGEGKFLHLISVADSLRFGVVAPLVRLAKELMDLGRLPHRH